VHEGRGEALKKVDKLRKIWIRERKRRPWTQS